MELSFAIPVRQRDEDEIAIFFREEAYSVGEILSHAREYSSEIKSFCCSKNIAPSQCCLILPSHNPVTYMALVFACAHAGVRMVPWRKDTLSIQKIMLITGANGVIQVNSTFGLTSIKIASTGKQAPNMEGSGNLIMMTSGSSGEPKGVLLDFERVVLNNTSAGRALPIDQAEIWAIDIDMSLMSATCHMIMAWQYSKPFYHLNGLDDFKINEIFSRHRVGFAGAPIQLLMLTKKLEKPNSPQILVSSGDFLTSSMIDELLDNFPNASIEKFYGLTELGGRFCCANHDQIRDYRDCVGLPISDMKLRLDFESPSDEIGSITAYSPYRFSGYFMGDGSYLPHDGEWFETGDLGSLEDSGLLRLLGRSDDVIKVNGEKVDRNTTETALSKVLSGREFCVLGVPHPLLGQCLALFICSSSTRRPPAWSEIVSHLRETIGNKHIPAVMCMLGEETLPRLANGKLDRSYLKNNYPSFERLG